MRRLLQLPTAIVSTTCIAFLTSCSTAPLSPYTVNAAPLAGVKDERARFREIFRAVLEAHGHHLHDYRPCEIALTRVGREPGAKGKPVHLGLSQRHLVAGLVPGIGWECFADWLHASNSVAAHVRRFGYDVKLFPVSGLSSTEFNARQIRETILAMPLRSNDRRLVLIGYSKGAPDILQAIVQYPEIRGRIAAVVSAGGAVGGSPLANSWKQSQADLLRYWPGAKCQKGDEQAVNDLRPSVRRAWLAHHRLPRDFPYYSVVTYPDPARISAVLRGSYRKISKIDARNDSQLIFYDEVIPKSTLAAYINADHWALAVPVNRSHPIIGVFLTTRNAYPREALLEAVLRFIEEDLNNRSIRRFAVSGKHFRFDDSEALRGSESATRRKIRYQSIPRRNIERRRDAVRPVARTRGSVDQRSNHSQKLTGGSFEEGFQI